MPGSDVCVCVSDLLYLLNGYEGVCVCVCSYTCSEKEMLVGKNLSGGCKLFCAREKIARKKEREGI